MTLARNTGMKILARPIYTSNLAATAWRKQNGTTRRKARPGSLSRKGVSITIRSTGR